MQTRYLVVDMSNILHKTFYVNTAKGDISDELLIPLAYNASLLTLNKYFKLHEPDKIVFVYDRANWRYDYTVSGECVSKRVYKGHRRQNMTPKQIRQYEIFKQFVLDFEGMIRDHTSIICLAADKLEADDLIAGFCQIYHEDSEIFIISEDKDLLQLLQYENVQLVAPTAGATRDLSDWNNDWEYFLYAKAFKGDTGDNIQSAYPRLQMKKIEKAYQSYKTGDPYDHLTLLEHTWTDQESREMSVKALWEENVKLTDLSKQPGYIKELMYNTIAHEMDNSGKYSHFHFLKFLGKYQLKNVSKNLEQYIPLLSK